MSCFNIRKIRALRENMDYAESLKYIVCSNVSLWDVRRVESFLDGINTPWHNVCDGYLFRVFKEVGTICNTGITSVITLLNYDIKELYVTGMTFFNMNTFGKVYYDLYHDEAVKNRNFRDTPDKAPDYRDLRMDIHSQPCQISYFHKIISKHYNNPLTLDKYLVENFYTATLNNS